MSREIEVPVLVVGGGPVGLTLAIDLARRGIEILVIERRSRGAPPPPKCNHVAARSMEIFRRLSIAGALREAGRPADYPNDVSYRTRFTGPELTRIPIPCRRDRFTATGDPDTDWPTPEPPHRINQIFLEPILFAHAEAQPGLRILCESEVTGFEQDDDEVRAVARHLAEGAETQIRCSYLVGCDGGRSAIRRAMGAKLEGDAVIQRVPSSYIRAPSLLDLQRERPAWATSSLSPECSGNVYAIDGRERRVVHNYLRPDKVGPEAVDRDAAIRAILGVGPDFDYELIAPMDWVGRRLVADRVRERRIFIAGDAAHIWVPYAGDGMNAGIADAANLAWLLSAHLAGWAEDSILAAHEAERGPITRQVSHFVMDHAHAMAGQRGSVLAEIEADGAQGVAARRALGDKVYALNAQQYCCAGLNFGSFYEASPIIAHDGEAAPGYTMAEFTPSTVPGCRLPHLVLADRASLYDRLGEGYTLLRFDPTLDAAPSSPPPRPTGSTSPSSTWPRHHLTTALSSSPAPTSTSPGAATRCRRTRPL